MNKAFVIALSLILLSSMAPVQARHNKCDPQQNQRARWSSQNSLLGRLTPREVAQIRQQEVLFRRKENAYWADGRLSPNERRALERDLNRLNRQGYRQAYDNDRIGWLGF
jgi:hypothetical protein